MTEQLADLKMIHEKQVAPPSLPLELILLIAKLLMQLANDEDKNGKAGESGDNFEDFGDTSQKRDGWTRYENIRYERQRTLSRLALCSKVTLSILTPLLYRAPIFYKKSTQLENRVHLFLRNLKTHAAYTENKITSENTIFRWDAKMLTHPEPLGIYVRSINLSLVTEMVDLNFALSLLPKLTQIELYGYQRVHNTTMAALSKYCPTLSELEIQYCVHLTEKKGEIVLNYLAKFPTRSNV